MREVLGPYLPPGTRVRYDGLGEDGPEYGVVVHCWVNREFPDHPMHDCYVAFFGTAPPDDPPSERPYVLRYAAANLIVTDEDWRTPRPSPPPSSDPAR